MADFTTIFSQWKSVALSGSLLTAKHDPNNGSNSYFKFKTVLSSDMSSSLKQVILNEDFSEVEYYQEATNAVKDFYIVTPNNFDVPGYARHTGSIDNAEAYDKLRIYSGSDQGWHVCAETSSNIQGSVSSSTINLIDTWKK